MFFVCGGGAFFKMCFRRWPPDRKPLAFEENPRTNLEVQGPFGDEVTYPKFKKSCKFKILLFCETRSGARGTQKVAHHFPAHFRLAKTPSIATWDDLFFVPYGLWGGFDKTKVCGEMVRNFLGPACAGSGLTK